MVTREEARVYLNECDPEKCFWVNSGPVLKSLNDLSSALPALSDDAFSHHVNADKNDFSRWVMEVIGDRHLANGIMSSRSRESMIKKVKSRTDSLKRKAGLLNSG